MKKFKLKKEIEEQGDLFVWAAVQALQKKFNMPGKVHNRGWSKTEVSPHLCFSAQIENPEGFSEKEYLLLTGKKELSFLNRESGVFLVEVDGKVRLRRDYGGFNKGPADEGLLKKITLGTSIIVLITDFPSGGPHYDPDNLFWGYKEELGRMSLEDIIEKS